jgi:AcrR family transcriptional regulator
MPRPVNHENRARLLEAAVDYAIDNGLSDLSLRPLAKGLGVTPTTLTHHFGSKEQFVQAIVNRVRERIVEDLDLDGRPDADAESAVRGAWLWSSAAEHEQVFRLVFELYGRALQDPDRFATFLERVVAEWLQVFTERLEAESPDAALVEERATLGVAVVRGLLLDLLTTGDRARVDRAMDAFLEWFAAPAPRAGAAS